MMDFRLLCFICLLFCLSIPIAMAVQNNIQRSQSLIKIPAGDFQMGCSFDDKDCDEDEGPRGGVRVFVDEFFINRHEVSVAEYRHCVMSGHCQTPHTFQRNKYCNYDAPGRDQHPINCINWLQAQNYCLRQGGRLPLEAEWEKAARGGSAARFPWGHADATCQQAIMDDNKTRGSVPGEHDGCGEDRTWPRGSRAANRFGLYDMQGGTAEWVYNWFAQDAIQHLYAKGMLSAPDNGRWRVIRGGAWDEQAWAQTSSNRWAKPPSGHRSLYGSNGFRCVFKSRNALK